MFFFVFFFLFFLLFEPEVDAYILDTAPFLEDEGPEFLPAQGTPSNHHILEPCPFLDKDEELELVGGGFRSTADPAQFPYSWTVSGSSFHTVPSAAQVPDMRATASRGNNTSIIQSPFTPT